MAGKDVYNITLPDGTTVSVPAWASDRTLEMLVAQLDREYSLDKQLIKEIYNINIDTSSAEKKFKEAVEKIIKNQKDTAEADEKSREKFIKGLGGSVSNLVGKLNNTEKPLSTFKDLADSAATGLGKGLSELLGGTQRGKAFLDTSFAKIGGAVADGLGDVASALIGFNIAKLEQFEAAQKTMINAGAIFFEGANAYDNLYKRSIDAGISYTQMSNIVSEYGAGIQALGHGVSSGTDTFLRFFNDLNDSANSVGDFGLSSEQMARSYAEYINISRLTGTLNRSTIDAQSGLSNSYKTLMLETTALASLTGQNRDEILQKRMASLSDPETAAALKIMRESGNVQQADLFESLVTQFAVAGEAMGAPGQQLMDAISREAFRNAENIEQFDVRGMLSQTNPQLLAGFDAMDSSFLDGINNAIKTGDVAGGDIMNFVLSAYADLQNHGYDLAKLSASGSNEFAQTLEAITAGSIRVSTDLRNLIDKTGPELRAVIEETETRLRESGRSTVAMNNVTESFLTLQERITAPLDNLGRYAETLGDVMLEAVDWFKDRSATTEVPIAQSISQEDYSSRVTDMVNAASASIGTDLVPLRSELMEAMPVPYDANLLEEEGADPSIFEIAIHPVLNQRVYRLPDQLASIGKYMFMPPDGRYSGGSVSENTPYIVGEGRPGGLGELFVPKTAGNIFSNTDTKNMFNSENLIAAISELTRLIGNIPSNNIANSGPVVNIADSASINNITPTNISNNTSYNNVDISPRTDRRIARMEYPESESRRGNANTNSDLKAAIDEVTAIKKNYLETLKSLTDVVKHYNRLNDPLRS